MVDSSEKIASLLPKLDMYAMNVVRDDWGKLLAPFSPPLPQEGSVILASYFGDVFVATREGAVWRLKGLEGEVDKIADSKDAFDDRLLAEYDDFLKVSLLNQLAARQKLLGPERVYGLLKPLQEGGSYSLDNIGTAPVAEAFDYMASQYWQKLNAQKEAQAPDETDVPEPAPEAQAVEASPAKPKKKGWFS